MRNWIYSTWLMKGTEWECADAQLVQSSESQAKLSSLIGQYGQPTIETSHAGETVGFSWLTQGAKINLRQQPCE